jgi:hypothetical protein
MLGTSLFVLDKLYHIARFAAGKAVVGIGLGVNLAAWGIIVMEGAFYMVVPVGLYAVMRQQFCYGQPLFDVVYFHFSMILMFKPPFSGVICTRSPMSKPIFCSHRPSKVKTGALLALLWERQKAYFAMILLGHEKKFKFFICSYLEQKYNIYSN